MMRRNNFLRDIWQIFDQKPARISALVDQVAGVWTPQFADNDGQFPSVCLGLRVADTDVPVQPVNTSADHLALAPIRGEERIQALDVIRGVALLGIFLMNVEWFNRPIADLEFGLPQHVSGIDYAA